MSEFNGVGLEIAILIYLELLWRAEAEYKVELHPLRSEYPLKLTAIRKSTKDTGQQGNYSDFKVVKYWAGLLVYESKSNDFNE